MCLQENERRRVVDKFEDKIDKVLEEITSINLKIANLPCKIHKLRITLLETLVYGGVGLILLTFGGMVVANYWPKSVQASNVESNTFTKLIPKSLLNIIPKGIL